MNTRRLRARLDRLTRSVNSTTGQEKNRTCDFIIDPALAKALRDDYNRIWEVGYERDTSRTTGHLPPPPGTEDMLRARVAERATTIGCPAEYRITEVRNDEKRLDEWPRGTLNDAEDAEEAQLTARVEAFRYSPEGRARERIGDLQLQSFFGLSAAEQEELD